MNIMVGVPYYKTFWLPKRLIIWDRGSSTLIIQGTFAARALHSPRMALSLSFSSTYCIQQVHNQERMI